MGVKTCTIIDQTSPVAPARLFKALCLDNHNCMPKVVPHLIQSMDFLQGDSTVVGCVKQVNFVEGGPSKYVKSMIDEVDVSNFYVKYTNFEGEDAKLKCSIYESKIEPSGAGSHYKMACHFHTNGDAVVTEEEIKFTQLGMTKTFEAIEQYLLNNPEIYA